MQKAAKDKVHQSWWKNHRRQSVEGEGDILLCLIVTVANGDPIGHHTNGDPIGRHHSELPQNHVTLKGMTLKGMTLRTMTLEDATKSA
jgi:hypothetical protein